MNQTFRFAIMGAGKIASKFCEAVALTENAEVVAIASKSKERADQFAAKHGISGAYDSYAAMLREEKPDCVYIAVTSDAHYDLSMLCLDNQTPVICEKAMFLNSAQADKVFSRSRELGVFVMEAMWSRFLPSTQKAREWIREGRIGTLELANMSIGFCAEKDNSNRFYNPVLGGGAAYDITVYSYELMTYLIEEKLIETKVDVSWSESGVDITDYVTLKFEHTLAFLQNSLAANLDEKAVIYGEKGRIEIPKAHVGGEAYLYENDGTLVEHYIDTKTENGFVYEVQEVMNCIGNGAIESNVVPHSITLQCAQLFDQISAAK